MHSTVVSFYRTFCTVNKHQQQNNNIQKLSCRAKCKLVDWQICSCHSRISSSVIIGQRKREYTESAIASKTYVYLLSITHLLDAVHLSTHPGAPQTRTISPQNIHIHVHIGHFTLSANNFLYKHIKQPTVLFQYPQHRHHVFSPYSSTSIAVPQPINTHSRTVMCTLLRFHLPLSAYPI